MHSREEIIWAAGLFEGEGWFTIRRYKDQKGGPQAGLASTDQDVVERFQAAVGFGNIFIRTPRMPHHKPQWVWQVASFEYVQALIALLWPWLGVRRQNRAAEVLNTTRPLFQKAA